MALQDDIIGLLSNLGEGGDRATARQERGIELYENIGEILGDSPNYRRALRELTGLGSRGEDMTLEEEMRSDAGLADRVASIIEKYMADAATIGQVPDDMIVDDTRAAERMMETAGIAPREAVSIEELPAAAPRTPVSVEELPPMSRPELDEVAMASMAREFGGERQMNQERLRAMGLSSIEGGAVPLRDRLMEGQGEPMSGGEQLMFASSFIPLVMLPAAAAKVGIGAAQVARFLRAGKKGEQALREVIKKREYARDARGRFVSPNQGVSNPTPGARMTERATPGKGSGLNMGEAQLRDMGLFGRLAGGAAGGGSVGNIRDGIMRNYAMMNEGGSVDDEETKRIEEMNRRMDEATRDYLKGFPQGFIRDVRGLMDSDERLLNKAAKANIDAQRRRNFKRVYGD